MRRTLLAMLTSLGMAHGAWACSCAPTTRAETMEEADVVFTGTVQQVAREGFWNVATIAVTDVAKGTVDETVKVQTANSSAACGVSFAQGQTVELAAIQRKDRLHASLCSQMGLQGK